MHILEPSDMGTRNGRTPRSSPSTMSRAMTTAITGKPLRTVLGGIHLKLQSFSIEVYKIGSMFSYLAAAGDGVCNSKPPLGKRVAVVSRLRASRPCPSSVSMNCALN